MPNVSANLLTLEFGEELSKSLWQPNFGESKSECIQPTIPPKLLAPPPKSGTSDTTTPKREEPNPTTMMSCTPLAELKLMATPNSRGFPMPA